MFWVLAWVSVAVGTAPEQVENGASPVEQIVNALVPSDPGSNEQATTAAQPSNAAVHAQAESKRGILVGSRLTAGGVASDIGLGPTGSLSILAALVLDRFEAGLEVGGVDDFGDTESTELSSLTGVRLGALVGYRAPNNKGLYVPVRARGGVQFLTNNPEGFDGPDEVYFLGASAGVGFALTEELELEVPILDFQSFFWSNSVGGLEAALSLQAALRLAWRFAI